MVAGVEFSLALYEIGAIDRLWGAMELTALVYNADIIKLYINNSNTAILYLLELGR